MIPTAISPVTAVAVRTLAPPAVSLLAQKAIIFAGEASCACSPTVSALSPAATAISSMVPAAIALRCGGSSPAPPYPFDLTRARIRLEGLHSYSVVTTLMLNASLRLFSATPKPLKDGEKVKNIAKILFVSLITASVLSGLYTTVVFGLLGMYAKTAIGLNKDLADIEFFRMTANFRNNAFHTFIISLLSFNSSFILSLFLNYEGRMKWWVAGSATVLSVLSWWQWSRIMTIASNLIFS